MKVYGEGMPGDHDGWHGIHTTINLHGWQRLKAAWRIIIIGRIYMSITIRTEVIKADTGKDVVATYIDRTMLLIGSEEPSERTPQ